MQSTNNLSLFELNQNCCAVSKASNLTFLVDCANYYRAAYKAISAARKSIFVLGWDIDSRIELVRGDHAPDNKPVTFFELICQKARENPELQVYLNKWNYSTFFISQREPFWVRHWKNTKLHNIHVCLDGRVPLGACHHQKVIIVDDEVVFWGGMDIALGRWDRRDHSLCEPCREDPSGLPLPQKLHEFGPYHDIQAVATGPVVEEFAHLVRKRWTDACDIDPIPYKAPVSDGMPGAWPAGFQPQFRDVDVTLSRTIPKMRGEPAITEVEKLFIDQIAQAEKFIYIENQYLTYLPIARALNKQLRAKPDLQVLLVSCDIPQGMMERKVMWCGRVKFWDIVAEGGVQDRVLLVYPATQQDADAESAEESVHIHSKLTVIDNKFLRLGSSNICNRSMGMDTELDVTIAANNDESARMIEAIRNDLIREHSGRELADIQNIILSGQPVAVFAEEWPESHQHFRVIDDEKYRNERFVEALRYIGDPIKPFVPIMGRIKYHSGIQQGGEPRSWFFVPFILAALAALVAAWFLTPLSEIAKVENITGMLDKLSGSIWAMPYAVLLYALLSSVFFPATVLTVATVITFGAIKGFIISYLGMIICGLLGHAIGQKLGEGGLHNRFGKLVRKVFDMVRDSGIAGVATLRIIPTGPFMLMNMVFGAAGIGVANFLIGSIIGLAPGTIAIALTGNGISKIIEHPSPQNVAYLLLGIALWVAIIVISQRISKKWQDGGVHKGEVAHHAT